MEARKKEIAQLELKTQATDFWDDNQEAQRILKKMAAMKEPIAIYESLAATANDIFDIISLALEENDQNLLEGLDNDLRQFWRDFEEFELDLLFASEHDESNAIVSLHAGAGGTEAQDWVQMLLRMYTRWGEDNGFKVNLVDLLPGDEAGIKSAVLMVEGRHAYGKLKSEHGVHRLIRISPFDASGRRHTSFASVSVLPEIDEDTEVQIASDELRIDTFRSSGAGGQHVNKTDSAVRLTHLPTGIVVSCQNERSQHANKAAAMKILLAKLYNLKLKAQEDNLQKIKGEAKEIAWGSQIRTYVMNPFSMVKDHRTGVEVGNVGAVMDGDLNIFISGFLHALAENTLKEDLE